jgi:phosphonate transport system permease protein
MTAATAASRGARPTRPRPSIVGPIAFLIFLAITWWAASDEFGIDFDLPELLTNLTRGADILAEFWPPAWDFLPETFGPMLETVQMAIIASVIGCSVALPVSFLASRMSTPNRFVFVVDRSILSVVRALPDILYALIFVAAVGVGPLPGIMALILFNIAVVAKLLSETVDGVDPGPIEAARAAGGGKAQTVRWAIFPQVLPNYVAYSLYAFELNIRASAVIGIVGAGGIGNLINRERRYFNYDSLTVILIEIFLLVFVVELISIFLRRRLV